MFNGTVLFEGGYTVDPDTGDVNGQASLPGSTGSPDWLETLKGLGGKAIDAYKSYTGLEQQRAQIDLERERVRLANEAQHRDLQLKRDLLGYQGQAERARAAQSAAVAQRSYTDTVTGTASIPIALVLAGAAFWLLTRA